jgi:hypothetical protein
MSEAQYQAKLIKKLKKRFPGCEVVKNDAQLRQGILDLSIFWERRWGMLEVKDSETASVRPNQDYFVEKFNGMSFAAFIYPENEEEVLSEMERAFAS